MAEDTTARTKIYMQGGNHHIINADVKYIIKSVQEAINSDSTFLEFASPYVDKKLYIVIDKIVAIQEI